MLTNIIHKEKVQIKDITEEERVATMVREIMDMYETKNGKQIEEKSMEWVQVKLSE